MVLSGYKAGASKSKGLLSMKEIDEVIDKINKEVKISDDEVEEIYEYKKQNDNATSRDETASLRSSETFKSNEETLKTILEEKENELKENELKKLEEEINSMTDTDELEKVMELISSSNFFN